MDRVQLIFVQRRKGEFWSLEGIFETVAEHLPAGFATKVLNVPALGGSSWVLWKNLLWSSRLRADVVHVTGDIHYVILALRSKPRILTIHDVRLIEEARGIRRFLLWLIWFYLPCRAADRLTVVSEATGKKLTQVARIPAEKIRVVPNPISPNFQRVAKEWDGQRPILLHIGTTDNKNLDRVVEACAGLPVQLWILGRLNDRQRRFVEESGVDWKGYCDLPWSEVAKLYQQCDLVVFPSLYEGFGMPILEGQATGRPVLTSDRAPMREVAGGGALLVDPEDTGSIRKGLERLLHEPELRAELIRIGFENVKNYSPEAVAAQYAAVYREVLGG